jgi:hypothetical protein
MILVFGGNHTIYHWTDAEHVKHDDVLLHKSGFLNKGFFTVWTAITIAGWWWLGRKMRQISRETDAGPMTVEEGKRYIWKNTVWAAIFIVLFALTVLSSIPWLWLMSIDAHWYSYDVQLVHLCFVVCCRHIAYHAFCSVPEKQRLPGIYQRRAFARLGKFMFAFSIFWTYLWFSQFMLIWYANIPEETVYFEPRMQGPYRGIFFLNLIINFLAPLLILMRRGSKRNYGTITMMSVLIIFGHWLDFYQMVFPGISPDHVPFMLVDFGIALGFVGLIMFVTGRSLAKTPLNAKNHPFFKESIIHHT